jgi:outer membrane lipopolysaccharide assembly protein LptE/RlpB
MNEVAKTMSSLFSVYLGFVKAQFEMTGLKKEANLKVEEMSRAMSETLMTLHDSVESQDVKEMIRDAAKELVDKIRAITQG